MAIDPDKLVDDETEQARAEAGGIGGSSGRPVGEDPADSAVLEAGGGESEGFEESEAALIDHAQHGDRGRNVRRDAFAAEVESDRSSIGYSQADEVSASERHGIREDSQRESPDELEGSPSGDSGADSARDSGR